MSTLSLDLRGPGPSRYPNHTRGASVSLLIHGAGIAGLVLLPLLGTIEAPEIAAAVKTPLVKPIIVSLPSVAPKFRPRPRMAGASSAQAAARALSAPRDVPTLVSASDILDQSLSPSTGAPGTADGPGGGEGIPGVDCALGALCGAGPVQLAEPRHETPRVGGLIQEPRLIESRAPQYPPIAQAAGVPGRVILEAHVGEDGRILDTKILSGHPLFDEAALTSVRSRRYQPLLLNGVRSDFLVTITIIFNVRR